MYGRGATDDKGPVLGWLNVLEAHQVLGLELPVNIRFCFEGMEETDSDPLDRLIQSEVAKGSDNWFAGVDCVCIVSSAFPSIAILRLHLAHAMVAASAVRQLLAQYAHAVPDIWPPRDHRLQGDHLWAHARLALGRVRPDGARTDDGPHLSHGQARHARR